MKSLRNIFILKLLYPFIFVVAFHFSLNAQNHHSSSSGSTVQDYFNPWIVRVSGGTGVFLGDIKQNPLIPSGKNKSEWRFGGSVSLEYRFNPVISLRGQSLYTSLAGTKTSTNRNFNAEIVEGTLGMGFYPVNIFSTSNGRFAEFYLIAGIGVINFNAKLYELSTENLIASSGSGNGIGIGGMTVEPVLFAGFGIDFPLNGNWMISFETTNKALTNDLLDLTDSNFPNDVYNFTSLGLAYRFGIKSSRKSKEIKVKEIPAEETYISALPVNPEVQPIIKEDIKVEELPDLDTIIILKENEATPKIEENIVITIPIDEPLLPVEMEIKDLESTGYRVQILASSKRTDIVALSKKTGVRADLISESKFNNLFIYTTGSYELYEQVVDARNTLRSKPGTADAFVVYFVDGQRQKTIPVKSKQNK